MNKPLFNFFRKSRYFPAFRRIFLTLLFPGIIMVFPGTSFAPAQSKNIIRKNLMVHFSATVKGQPLELHKNYVSSLGETFRLDMFRFYVSNITASCKGKPAKKIFAIADHHLIDFADSSRAWVGLTVPEGTYDSINFQLGIDSADQNSGAQTGALDPLKGMFWTWNSGYLGLKMEGTSPASGAPAHAFAYHLGGFRYPNAIFWSGKLGIPGDLIIQAANDGRIALDITLDLDLFFNGAVPIHISETPACTTPGALARSFFENFCSSFTGVTQSPGQ